MKEIKKEELKTTENQRGLKDSLTKRRHQDNAGLEDFYPEPYKNKQNIYLNNGQKIKIEIEIELN